MEDLTSGLSLTPDPQSKVMDFLHCQKLSLGSIGRQDSEARIVRDFAVQKKLAWMSTPMGKERSQQDDEDSTNLNTPVTLPTGNLF